MATQSSSGKSRKKSKPEKIGGYSPTQKIGQGHGRYLALYDLP